MPSNHKVYQKNHAVKEKFALMKFFFCPLCAISLFISRLRTPFRTYDGKVVLWHGCPHFQSGRDSNTPVFFVHIATEDRATWRRPERRSEAIGRAGGCVLLTSSGPLHSIFLSIVIAVLISGCIDNQHNRQPKQQPEISVQQKEARLKVIEKFVNYFGKKRQREKCLLAEIHNAEQASKCFECHDLWKEWEQEQLRKEPDGTENVSNKKSSPGSGAR